MEIYHLSFLAAGAAPEDDYGDRAFAKGQWRCGLKFPGCRCRGPGSTMPLERRVSAMGNGECSPGSQPTLRGTLAAPSIY